MKSKRIILIVIFCIFSGCGFFKGKIAEDVLPGSDASSLAILESDLKVVAGINLLEDKRPEVDVSYMASVRENVTNKLLETIKSIDVFSGVNYPPKDEDVIIISGEIRKFRWQSFDTMISYIPVMNVFNLFGLPSTRTHSEVEIYLEVRDADTKKVLFDINEKSVKDKKYNIYNFKDSKANEELSLCFIEVLEKIRYRFLDKENLILEVVKSKIPVVTKTESDKKDIKEIEKKMKEAEKKIKEAEKKMKEVEKKAEVVEKIAEKVEEKVKAAEEKVKTAEEGIGEEFQ